VRSGFTLLLRSRSFLSPHLAGFFLLCSYIRIALVNDTQSVRVAIDADGRVELPVRPDRYKMNAEFRSNQPKGSLTSTITISVGWSGGSEIPYSEAGETVRQLETGAKDLLGWFGHMLFFPSITRVDIPIQYKTPNGERLDIVKGGKIIQTLTADEKGLLVFRLDRRWSEWQPKLVFSEAPPKT
jgi:hypothetical protein